MSRDYTICGLDIGSNNIRAIVAQRKGEAIKPQILGVAQTLASGMRKGVVVDVEETVKDIKKVVEDAERISGVSFDNVYVSIGGTHINAKPSRGVVAVSRADGEISPEDVARAVSAAQAISLGQNREVIHILPRYFVVDGQDMIKDPVGMNGIRLEVDTLIINGSSPFIKNLNKCVRDADIALSEFVFSPLAAAHAILSRRQKELGVLVLDFGGGTTGLTVFEEGDMIHSQVLPVGSSHITNDIAIGLRTSIDVAEKVKLEYGSVLPREINKKELIDLSKLGGEDEVSRHELAEIIEARVGEIIDLVNKELKRIDRQGLLPAGVVLVGGGAKIPGLVDFVKEKLRLPAQIGFPTELEGVIDRVDDPAYATIVGLIVWGNELANKDHHRNFNFSLKPFQFSGIFAKIRRFLKSFLP